MHAPPPRRVITGPSPTVLPPYSVGHCQAVGVLALSQGHRVAVIAVDPTSPRTGGSILGALRRDAPAGDLARLRVGLAPMFRWLTALRVARRRV